MERQNDRLRGLRRALCGALVSLTAYLLELMLWTHLTLAGTLHIEQLSAGIHPMAVSAAALGAAVCVLRGEVRAALPSALGFWLSVLLLGVLCGGEIVPRAALAQAVSCALGALAAVLLLRRDKRRRGGHGKHKRRRV